MLYIVFSKLTKVGTMAARILKWGGAVSYWWSQGPSRLFHALNLRVWGVFKVSGPETSKTTPRNSGGHFRASLTGSREEGVVTLKTTPLGYAAGLE